MVVGGSQQETLDPGFVLLGTLMWFYITLTEYNVKRVYNQRKCSTLLIIVIIKEFSYLSIEFVHVHDDDNDNYY
ncbi:unnamed protein product [Schistosoma margrebowiei]|uniref:Uncharacterized protein n=1 Tax=Schistosoma margrebowiei TaxID=48269 RepID=A0A183N098_9TREM|nr:unnamed protein product [Schistosoma margrebowiei]